MQPGPSGRVSLELVQITERRKEGVLYGVGAITFASKKPAGYGQHAATVLPHECRTGLLVTGSDAGLEVGLPPVGAGLSEVQTVVSRDCGLEVARQLFFRGRSCSASPAED